MRQLARDARRLISGSSWARRLAEARLAQRFGISVLVVGAVLHAVLLAWGLHPVDRWLLDAIGFSPPTRPRPWARISFQVGNASWIALGLLALALVGLGRERRPAVAGFVASSGIATAGIDVVAKMLDSHQPGFAYPSGHVAGAATVATVAVVLASGRRRHWTLGVAAVGALLPVVVAAGAIGLAAHGPSDLVGGVLLGVGSTLTAAGLWRVPASR